MRNMHERMAAASMQQVASLRLHRRPPEHHEPLHPKHQMVLLTIHKANEESARVTGEQSEGERVHWWNA